MKNTEDNKLTYPFSRSPVLRRHAAPGDAARTGRSLCLLAERRGELHDGDRYSCGGDCRGLVKRMPLVGRRCLPAPIFGRGRRGVGMFGYVAPVVGFAGMVDVVGCAIISPIIHVIMLMKTTTRVLPRAIPVM